MFTMSSTLWKLALAGSLATAFAFFKIDVETATQAGTVAGILLFSAMLASLWDG